MDPRPQPVTLPLEALLGALEQAGFDTSPATRLRAWRVLEGLGREKFLQRPAALKTYLAPVFARNAVEQERFYAIFDRFAEGLKAPDEAVEVVEIGASGTDARSDLEPPPESAQDLSTFQKLTNLRAFWKILTGIVLLALGVFLWTQYRPKPKITHPEPNFATNLDLFAAGDTVICQNTTDFSKHDTADYAFSWRLERTDGTIEFIGPLSTHWRFVAPPPDTGAQRQIVLTLRHKPSGKQKAMYSDIRIACKNRPHLPKIALPSAIAVGKSQRFGLAEKPRPGLAYRWQIIGDTLVTAPAFDHTFAQNGVYEVNLVVIDTTQAGACIADTTFTLRVGQEKVQLPYKRLQMDKAEPVAMFGWLAYLLMALLGLGVGWAWIRWVRRKRPTPDAPVPGVQTPSSGGWGADKPPYFIPFREQKGVLRTAREQFRFGDALRLRQEGQHRVFDILATLRATLDRGGYPTLRFRYQSKPTDYLFLVDEQLPGNHQARLFRHLAENLRGQDVALELFWYDAGFHRFWNRELPEGVSLDGLRRLFPDHRLVLLGSGHVLVDPSDAQTPRLRPTLLSALRGWRERLLLTPVLPGVWNWREGALFREFPLFPADLRGLSDAAVFIETGLDIEDMPPSFWAWQQRQAELRQRDAGAIVGVTRSHPDNAPSWRTAKDHETYLAPYAPDLLRWLRALAVTPSPVWETTLAIARALGIAVNHDRLLAMARIPALQEGEWHPRLRRELLQSLDPDDERRARTAVRAELEAVREQAKDSHAALELESGLAVQQFILDPDDEANRTLIVGMMDAGLLTRRQEEELDFVATRMTGKKTTIQDWFVQNQPEVPPPPKRPFFIPAFWRAAAASLLFLLLLGLGVRYTGTAALRHLVFPEKDFVPGRDTLRDFILVREAWTVDSALIYNNLGVVLSVGVTSSHPDTMARPNFERGGAYFLKARNARLAAQPPANYPLAADNQFAAYYNHAAWLLNQHVGNKDSLTYADTQFDRALAVLSLGNDTKALSAAFQERSRLSEENIPEDSAQAPILPQKTTKPGQKQPMPGKSLAGPAQKTPTTSLAPNSTNARDAAFTVPFFIKIKELALNSANVLDAAHGKGVVAFYLDDKTSAWATYEALKTAGYFDTLSLRPNLQTLLLKTPGDTSTTKPPPTAPDRDRDGIPDAKDKCPDQAAPGTTDGCPDVTAIIAAIERNMVRVEGDTFTMGCTAEQGEDCFNSEKPQHQVIVSDYAIGRTEVTVAQYMAFVNETKSHYPEWLEVGSEYNINTGTDDHYKQIGAALQTPNHPIVGVSWDDAVAYCKWLSQKTGKNYRLPTEAEWEYAARGGAVSQKTKYAGSDNLGEVAWYTENSGSKTHPVGQKKANELGLYDMSGNVWEWCSDPYGEYKDSEKPVLNPKGADKGDTRVIRGGSRNDNARGCRGSTRSSYPAAARSGDLGFRLSLH